MQRRSAGPVPDDRPRSSGVKLEREHRSRHAALMVPRLRHARVPARGPPESLPMIGTAILTARHDIFRDEAKTRGRGGAGRDGRVRLEGLQIGVARWRGSGGVGTKKVDHLGPRSCLRNFSDF